MRKSLVMTLMVFVLLALTACGGNDDTGTQDVVEQTPPTATEGGETTATGSSASQSTPGQTLELMTQTIAGTLNTSRVVTADGLLWAWGRNTDGVLGDGTTENQNRPVEILDDVVAVATPNSSNATFAIRTDGTLWSWGSNTNGQLGHGLTQREASEVITPTQIMENVVHVTAGGSGTLAITADGGLYAWGFHKYSEFEDRGESSWPTPTRIRDNIAYAVAGYGTFFYITPEGALWGWGANDFGQVGNGERRDPGSTSGLTVRAPIHIMDNVINVGVNDIYGKAVTIDGALWGWGFNIGGQLGADVDRDEAVLPTRVMGKENVAAVSVGRYHTMVLLNDGSLWAWGENERGQIGTGVAGINERELTPVHVMDDVVSMSARAEHSLAITSDGTLWSWGWNREGQLGRGYPPNFGTPGKVMGGARLP